MLGQAIYPILNLAFTLTIHGKHRKRVFLLQKPQNGFEPSAQRHEAVPWTVDEALGLIALIAKILVKRRQAIETTR